MTKKNKNHRKWLIIGWVFFLGIILGRVLGIILTHDDVTNVSEFLNRLGVWDFFYIVMFVILVSGSIKLFKK